MESNEIRKRFLEFMKENGHAIIPSASLVTTDEKGVTDSTLFNTAGMQPLIPYLLGKEHPAGKRLANSQKCIRTIDIDEVGDNTHATFFEMLGNWSLGDYFKEEAIKMSYQFLTNKEKGLGLDPKKLYVTCFAGNEDAPKDEEAAEIWKSVGHPESRIYFTSDDNWWSAGDNGPCGPDTEMFYNVTDEDLGDMTHEEFIAADDAQKIVEIWNDVFMEYEKKDGKVIGKLPNKNVDTGAGLERLTAVLQEKESIFETDVFGPMMLHLDSLMRGNGLHSMNEDEYFKRSKRIIADHIRATVFMIADGVTPSNKDRGFVLRKILKRTYEEMDILNIIEYKTEDYLVGITVDKYKDFYPSLKEKESDILNVIKEEFERNKKLFNFNDEEIEKKLNKALKKMGKTPLRVSMQQLDVGTYEPSNPRIDGEEAFYIYSTYGIPKSKIIKFSRKNDYWLDIDGFNKEFKKHQETSRTAAEGKFKGGLAGTSEEEVRFHTATHLLHAALRNILGDHVFQKGSNITPERLRFDFSHPDKMTDEEKQKVEDWVNEKIDLGLPVIRKEMSYEEAKSQGAMGLFEDKYGDKVSVYSIGEEPSDLCSIELCGGPHVSNTKELGKFKIKKEEASSAGVRRIKAVFE